MSEGQEIKASHEEVEQFVGKLRVFYGDLDPVTYRRVNYRRKRRRLRSRDLAGDCRRGGSGP